MALFSSRRSLAGATLHKIGGRQADDFYRDRWSHDKVVRSTHGVNCTGSCSWKVYVKDGIITWESQQTDYPSVGPDRPEYEPRGCPRGAAFSWYTYSPTRVRYPYVRGVLLEMYREAKARLGDPVLAWADIVADPERSRRYKQARGKGGLVRATWDEAIEIVAAAHVHTIKRYGPDRVAGFSPIPAMSMVSHAAGARFYSLIGGAMLSFYDWYADLPVASPQVFGDQTDVPESGDWWDAGYLIMWGSNVPVTRTPDAHWMAEARYRGQKVVAVPRLRRQREVRRRVAPRPAGHRRRAGDGHGPRHPQGVLRRPAGAVLHRLRQEVHRPAVPGHASATRRPTFVPGKFLTAADLGARPSTPSSRRCCWTPRPASPSSPTARWGIRYGDEGVGKWNLDLGDVDPMLSATGGSDSPVTVQLPRFDAPDGSAAVLHRGVPVRRVNGHLVTTVFDLMLAQYGVARTGCPGTWPTGYDDADEPYTPAWQETITGVAGTRRPRGSRASSPPTPRSPTAAR